MEKESQSAAAVSAAVCQKDVVLNLTISGAREQILSLLEQMEAVPGFSVVKGSFVVLTSRNSSA